MEFEILKMLFLSVVVPALICALFLFFAWRPSKTKENHPGNWGAAIGIPFGYVFGYWAIVDFPTSPFTEAWESWQGVFYLTIFAAGLSVVDAKWRVKNLYRLIVALLFSVAVAVVMIPSWTDNILAKRVILAVCMVLFSVSLEMLAQRLQGYLLPLTMAITATAVSVMLILAHNLKLAQLIGPVGAMCGVCFLFSLRYRSFSLSNGAILPISLVLCGLLANGVVADKGQIPFYNFLLIILAPSLLWLMCFGALRDKNTWKTNLLRVFVLILPITFALYQAGHIYITDNAEQSSQTDEDYGYEDEDTEDTDTEDTEDEE